jgi:hypothetical protein
VPRRVDTHLIDVSNRYIESIYIGKFWFWLATRGMRALRRPLKQEV